MREISVRALWGVGKGHFSVEPLHSRFDVSPESMVHGPLPQTRDKDTPALITRELELTDFPLEHIKLYLADFTLMLPTEY